MRDDVSRMTDRDDQRGGEVLGSLPARRPQRRSARRDGKAASKPPAKPPEPEKRPQGVRPSAATDAASSTPGERPASPPEGVELLGTAVQAAGELAELGLRLGTKALRGAVKRLPRP